MNFIRTFGGFVLAMSAANSHAGFISGTHILSNGKSVELQNLEWMPLTATQGISRLDIEDGFIDRMGSLWSASDWRYATRNETEKLLGSLWGGSNQLDESNFAGADWFLTHFGIFHNYSASFFFGADGDCDFQSTMSCIGEVSISYNEIYGVGNWGKFLNEYGLKINPEDRINNSVYKLRTDLNGSLLVRTKDAEKNAIPTPNTGALFLLALGLGVLNYRKIKNKSAIASKK